MHQNTIIWWHEEEHTVHKLLLLPRKEILQEWSPWSIMGNTLLAGSSRASVMPGLERSGISGALLSHSPTGDTESQLLRCTSYPDLKKFTTLISCLQSDPQSPWAPWSMCVMILKYSSTLVLSWQGQEGGLRLSISRPGVLQDRPFPRMHHVRERVC